MGKNEVEKTNKANIRKADFLAVSEACKDAFWPSPGVDLSALPSQHPGLHPRLGEKVACATVSPQQ